jgi:hypothetical protein
LDWEVNCKNAKDSLNVETVWLIGCPFSSYQNFKKLFLKHRHLNKITSGYLFPAACLPSIVHATCRRRSQPVFFEQWVDVWRKKTVIQQQQQQRQMR